MFEYENDLLIIDELIHDPGLPYSLVVRIDGAYYMINHAAADVRKKPIAESALHPYKKHPGKNWDRAHDYEYLMAGMVPRGGFDVSVKRAITDEEFEAICKEYDLSDEDISEEFADTVGTLYGEEYAQKITSKQIQVPMGEAIPLETKLKGMGIQAANVAPGKVNIRTGHGGARTGAGRPLVEDKKIARSIKFTDAEWDAVKQRAETAGLSASEYVRKKSLE